MTAIRVLVVDDSVVVRQTLGKILDLDAKLELAGTASNGQVALQQIKQLEPDVVLLDTEMPILDGVATVGAIREAHPHLPVIMLSSVSEQAGALALVALERGASDYITKPGNDVSIPESALPKLQQQVLRKVLALFDTTSPLSTRASFRPSAFADYDQLLEATRPPTPPRVVAIGSSTGGPQALTTLLSSLDPRIDTPIVIAHHMPATFTKLFAERLGAQTGRRVAEGRHGAELEPGSVWLAPGDYHMTVAQTGAKICLQLNQEPPENSCRPSVNPLFRSVAKVYGRDALCLVLTGMGRDGFLGAQQVADTNGTILVQDEKSSVVWGMPGFVAKAGLAQEVLPPEGLAREIGLRILGPESVRSLLRGGT